MQARGAPGGRQSPGSSDRLANHGALDREGRQHPGSNACTGDPRPMGRPTREHERSIPRVHRRAQDTVERHEPRSFFFLFLGAIGSGQVLGSDRPGKAIGPEGKKMCTAWTLPTRGMSTTSRSQGRQGTEDVCGQARNCSSLESTARLQMLPSSANRLFFCSCSDRI
jgi:hypothetical protein